MTNPPKLCTLVVPSAPCPTLGRAGSAHGSYPSSPLNPKTNPQPFNCFSFDIFGNAHNSATVSISLHICLQELGMAQQGVLLCHPCDECTHAMIMAHCSLSLPRSSDLPTSASRRWGLTILLELLGSSDPPALASQSFEITGMSHHAKP
ncbi:hypothetical protein AAY473_033579 [Plecturocebus cupreus]